MQRLSPPSLSAPPHNGIHHWPEPLSQGKKPKSAARREAYGVSPMALSLGTCVTPDTFLTPQRLTWKTGIPMPSFQGCVRSRTPFANPCSVNAVERESLTACLTLLQPTGLSFGKWAPSPHTDLTDLAIHSQSLGPTSREV